MKKTLFLSPPSFEGFDGGAGSRYQCKREVTSFWYPTWLAQLAALVPDSTLIDGPASGVSLQDIVPEAKKHEVLIVYTSTPTFHNDVQVAEAFKKENPDLLVGFCGAHVVVTWEEAFKQSPAIDFICDKEFDFTVKSVCEGRELKDVKGLYYRDGDNIKFTGPSAVIEDMDSLPWVTPIYKKFLNPKNYYNGYMLHPYMSIYTGRGCKSRCTYCLWPQTISGHNYRTRSIENIVAEIAYAKKEFPEIKEFFFDDDTLTDNIEHVEALAKELGKLGVTWSCNAKANVPRKTLEVLKANGLRLLLVGYESGNQKILNNMKKGLRLDFARKFTKDCHDLGILIHGCFIMGLPGEDKDTIRETIEYAKEIDPKTIQVSLPATYPGTFLYNQAMENGWLQTDNVSDGLVNACGTQESVLSYPHLDKEEIFQAVEVFYKEFYFRPGKMAQLTWDMLKDPQVMKRQLREGKEFFKFLWGRKEAA